VCSRQKNVLDSCYNHFENLSESGALVKRRTEETVCGCLDPREAEEETGAVNVRKTDRSQPDEEGCRRWARRTFR
jgi:hypothetical protein